MVLGVGLLVSGQTASAQLAPGSLDVKWSEGAEQCEVRPPQAEIQVHEYNAQTFILRENLCATFEAPFIYLLLGSSRALLKERLTRLAEVGKEILRRATILS